MVYSQSFGFYWILFYVSALLSKYIVVWSRDTSHVEYSNVRHDLLLRYWSDWTAWSVCSRTCGGGVTMRTRVCKIRTVSYATAPTSCLGETTEYELCARQNCSPYSEDFLSYQCSQHNGQSVGGRKIQEWLPYPYGKNPCELQCWSKERSAMYSFGKVIDGTKCTSPNPSQPALCVNGRCMTVDCAGLIGLDNRRDRCGVCRGDNSTCVKYQNTFWSRPRNKVTSDNVKDHHYDYDEIASIPAGATQVLVKENSETNFLVLVDHKGNHHINGNWRIQTPGQFLVHGSEFIYNRTWDGQEMLSTAGPTRFNLFIFVLGSGDIPTVHYEYWISKEHLPSSVLHLLPLNQLKNPETLEKLSQNSKVSHSLDNRIPDEVSIKSKVIPTSKLQGYRSYYHRNEILKSVPSWSIKRHRNYKNVLNNPYYNQNNVTPSTTEYSKITTRLRLLDTEAKQNDRELSSRKVVYSPSLQVTSSQTGESRNDILSLNELGRPNRTSAYTRLDHPYQNVDREKSRRIVASKSGEETKRKNTKKKDNKSVPDNRSDNKQSKKRRDSHSDKCSCVKAKNRKRNFCLSDFVIRAVVLAFEKHQHRFRYELEVTQSYKNKVPMTSREYVWTTDFCRCPRLHRGREYIIMGHSGTIGGERESKLLVSKDSFVRRFTHGMSRTIMKLVRDQYVMCKKYR